MAKDKLPEPVPIDATSLGKIDAALIPADYPPGVPQGPLRQKALRDELRPLLGENAGVGWPLLNGSRMNFVKPDPRETFLFPVGHIRAGEPRYTWVDRGDGVQYGTKVEGADDIDWSEYIR